MKACLHCNELTKNPKFCNSSCAAKYNNVKYPKRKPTHKCKLCGGPITADKRLCKECHYNVYENPLELTIEETLVGNAQHPSWLFAKIRARARTIYHRHNEESICKICGYSKHIEVCHIIPISKFAKTAKLSEVNALSNLVGLCRNCHWELDHGLLDFPEFEHLHS